jgi:hypothetical protein
MFKIHFLPDSDLDDVSEAIKEYEHIWNVDGEKIVYVWQELSGYVFKETFINAVIYGRKGGLSHPLCLKGNCTLDEKKIHLVHELGHRILLPPRRELFKKYNLQPTSLDNHKIEYLVLYDVYEAVYGKEFADFAVKWDRENLGSVYKEAWDFALSFKTKEVRQEKFKEMMK